MKTHRYLLSLVLVGVMAASASGCFGKFAATRALYNFNSTISTDKVVRSLVMCGLIIIPVYGLFGLGDVVLFNVIEFWGGTNPIVEAQTEVDGTVRLVRGGDVYELRPVGAQEVRVSLNGTALGRALFHPDGTVLVVDTEGAVLRMLTPADFAQVEQRGEFLALGGR
jgi:hypothetical protein